MRVDIFVTGGKAFAVSERCYLLLLSRSFDFPDLCDMLEPLFVIFSQDDYLVGLLASAKKSEQIAGIGVLVILDIIVAGKGEKEGVTGEREREDFVRAGQFHTVNIITSLRGLMRGADVEPWESYNLPQLDGLDHRTIILFTNTCNKYSPTRLNIPPPALQITLPPVRPLHAPPSPLNLNPQMNPS